MDIMLIIDKVMVYGPLGLITLAMGWYILFKDKKHLVERSDCMDRAEKREQQMIDVVEKNATSITKNTSAIDALTMSLKNGQK